MALTRRDFIKKIVLTGIVINTPALTLAGAAEQRTPKRDYILIGHPNPSTGPIAAFGDGSPWVDEKAVSNINAKGGIFIREYNKKLPIKVRVVDTESDPVKAANAASSLILQDRIDLMVALHTPDTTNPVAAVCERYEIPCICLDTPIESWLSDGPYKWSYHAFWSIESLAEIQMCLWDEFADQTNRIVGGLWPDDPDGIAWADIFNQKLPKRGYKLIDPGRFPVFTKDFTEIIELFKHHSVEIITGVLTPPDWSNAWRQCHQMGFGPKIAIISKAVLFPASVEGLGSKLANGLVSEVWWSPYHPFRSSLTGQNCREFCDEWTRTTGKIWTQVLGFKHAGFEIAVDALQRAQTLERESLRKAIADTDLDTIVGHISYNAEHYSETPLVLGQWISGDRDSSELRIVFNKTYPPIAKNSEMIFPLDK